MGALFLGVRKRTQECPLEAVQKQVELWKDCPVYTDAACIYSLYVSVRLRLCRKKVMTDISSSAWRNMDQGLRAVATGRSFLGLRFHRDSPESFPQGVVNHDADANDKLGASSEKSQNSEGTKQNGTGYVKAGPWGSTIQLRGALSLSGSSTNANRVKPVAHARRRSPINT